MENRRFLCVCLNPVIQNTLVYERLDTGEVNRSSEYRLDASGKGVNVARVLAQTGRDATYLTQLGGPTRDWFLSMCLSDGLSVRWVESNSEIRVCTTVIDRSKDGGSGGATELVQEARNVERGTGARVLSAYEEELSSCAAVIFSGTKAPGFPEDMIPKMARLAAERGKSLILDIKGADLVASLPFRPLVAKPNLEELLQTYAPDEAHAMRDGKVPSDASLRDLVFSIGKEYKEKWGTCLVVTRGAKPTLYWDGSALREYQGPVVKAYNPIGSGDSFTAGLATTLVEGGSLPEAVAEGSRLGALNAQRLKPGSIL
jgi:fructose-1-phosphate kinase PfkB-like protein